MLVIDENKMKLLKMKEKLLEVSFDNYQQHLADYKELAIEIDKQAYDALIEQIKNTDYYSLPLEEQAQVLTDIKGEYDSLNELQCSFRNVYRKYTSEELGLSDIHSILIDQIDDRINKIQGYLVNNYYLENNKKQLENLNLELIDEEKRRISAEARFHEMEKELRDNFLNAEGRITSNVNQIEYTSVIKEYNDNGFDLKQMLADGDLLDKILDKTNSEKNSAEEKLVATKICYESAPTYDNKEIYDSIAFDMVKIRYRLTLVQMANLVARDFSRYESIKTKREQLKALNDVRLNCLKKMNVNVMIDPFSRIKLDEQLSVIDSFNDNKEKIAVTRRNITNLSTVIDSRIKTNTDFMVALNVHQEFVKDKTSFDDVKFELNEDTNNDDLIIGSSVNESDSKTFEYDENQVVKVTDLKDGFLADRVKEKTDNVISAVIKLFNQSDEKEIEIVTPELSIQPVLNSETIDTSTSEEVPIEIQEENNEFAFLTEPNSEIFTDNNESNVEPLFDNSSNEKNMEPTFLVEPSEEIFTNMTPSNDIADDSNNIKDTPEVKFEDWPVIGGIFEDSVPITNNSEKVTAEPLKEIDSDLFQETKPFDDIALFNDKFEDVFSSNDKATNDTKSDIFSDNNGVVFADKKVDDNTLTDNQNQEMFWTIDESINNDLIENEEPKTKRR